MIRAGEGCAPEFKDHLDTMKKLKPQRIGQATGRRKLKTFLHTSNEGRLAFGLLSHLGRRLSVIAVYGLGPLKQEGIQFEHFRAYARN